MGFHIAFFAARVCADPCRLFALAACQGVCEIEQGYCSDGEGPRRESKDGFVDHHGAGDPWPAAADHSGEWQTGSLEMAHMDRVVPFSPGAWRGSEGSINKKAYLIPRVGKRIARTTADT
jgi:hypothetical protein